ncbi:hypothetical protein BGX21_005681 [Mortierella sp. AD011]|nr:hypothetical protein BGX21_005681 [Mortierella sp. AD011]
MSNTFKERAFQHRGMRQEGFNNEDTSFHPAVSTALSLPTALGGTGVASSDSFTCSQKNHVRCKDSGDCMQELQPRRKARRVMDGGPYFKERNHRLVAGHVRKLIQEAVEDGVGELDLSNLELTDLPSEICDLNFAIVYNERGSFSLSSNRLKLFLSSNMFSTVPMDVFALHNLSDATNRAHIDNPFISGNNSIEAIPPEIGLLHNLVELSIGGNLLKVLPSQIILLPKLHILTVHPNPFLTIPEPGVGNNNNLGLANHNEPPAFNGAHNGINTMAPEAFEEHNMTNHNRHIQLQASLISPPVSPPTSQSEDVDMMPPPEQDGVDSGSPPSTILRPETTISDVVSEQTQRTGEPSSSQSYSFTSSVSIGEPSSQHTAVSTVTSEASIGESLPHLTTRSRFPTLLVLAGNALLNYMESQSASAAAKKGGQGVERPRKDSKISMGGDEWVGISSIDGNGHHQQEQWSETKRVENRRGGSPVASRPSKKQYVFKEDIIKSHLTPYLYDNFKRARTNNLCAGCQKRFWKPCRIVVVWQDILGQSSVPVEWRGCGIGGCLGVPASMQSSPLPVLTPSEPSSPASNSMSIVTSPSGSGSSSHSTSST